LEADISTLENSNVDSRPKSRDCVSSKLNILATTINTHKSNDSRASKNKYRKDKMKDLSEKIAENLSKLFDEKTRCKTASIKFK
jgi:muramidase (phage lysozyme)